MFQWAQKTFDQISQTVAPPPTDGPGRFSYSVQRNEEDTAMGCIAEFDPVYTILNQAKGWYPIHLACQYSQTRLIRLLLNQPGINIDHPDVAGNTSLHLSCMSTDVRALEVVQMLVNECGANVLAKNGQGQTPYDVATSNNVRQFLLPIQLQKETQIALDNGGQGLPPGIDLGGLRINKLTVEPPPMSFGSSPAARTQSTGRYPPTPMSFGSSPAARTQSTGMYPPTPIPGDQSRIAPAPATMPANVSADNNTATEGGYSLKGSSSAAIFSNKYVADGFHSSSSDINLQQKYGHDTTARQYVTAPPPSSGTTSSRGSLVAPMSGNAAGDGVNNPFSRGSALPKNRYVAYGPEAAPAAPVAAQPAYNQYSPAAPAAANYNSFAPGVTTTAPQPAGPITPAQSTQSISSAPSTPYMPPPPYQTQNYETPSQRPDFVSPAAATYGGSPMTPATSGAVPVTEKSAHDLFAGPAGVAPTSTASAPISGTSAGSAQELFAAPATTPVGRTPSAPISGASVGSAHDLFAAPQSTEPASEVATSESIFTPPKEQKGSQETPEKEPVSATETEEVAPSQETSTPAADGAETSSPTEATAEAPKADPQATATDEDWVETTDPSTGQTYYYNKVTNQTSWEDPKSTTAEIGSTESDWVETPDPTTGKTYYYNEVTQETSWEKPIGEKTEEKTTEEWVEVSDPSSGQTYYYNQKTQETSWENPTAQTESPDDSQAAVEWIETVDPSSGQMYYYNQITQETSWEKPQSLHETKTAEAAPTDLQGHLQEPYVTNDSDISNDWIETVDPSSGDKYYYNQVTQETSWENPKKQATASESIQEAAASATSEDATQSNAEDTPPAAPITQEQPGVVPSAESMTSNMSAQELFGEGPPAQEQSTSDPQKEAVDEGAPVSGGSGSAEQVFDNAVAAEQSSQAAQSASVGVSSEDGQSTQSTAEEQKPGETREEPVVDDIDGDGEMLDVPLSPKPSNLKTSQPEAQPEPSAGLFAAIGMPPPPFQSKR
jgi:hypothetical protein